MAGIEDRVLFYDATSDMEDEEQEKGYEPSLCFLDCSAFRHPRHRIVERSLLHHHHQRVEESRQEDGGGPTARTWSWPSREIGANDDGYSLKGAAAPSRWKQAFFQITRRLNTAGVGRSSPPTRRTAQFLYNPQSYAFNFEKEGRSARFLDFAQRYAPPEKIKEEEAPMNSQIPGGVKLL